MSETPEEVIRVKKRLNVEEGAEAEDWTPEVGDEINKIEILLVYTGEDSVPGIVVRGNLPVIVAHSIVHRAAVDLAESMNFDSSELLSNALEEDSASDVND